jgi:SAM-dependent methyltransferase
MSTFGDSYILAAGQSGHDRLRLLCEIHDPGTHELLTRAGISTAQRYVEFGCGLGYVSRWAASQAAHVTAIDLSEEQLVEARKLITESGLTNVEFQQANIYEHGLAAETYDISYSRYLMVHLNDPVQAMREIFKILKPGGTMVCEEVDISVIYTEPFVEGYQAFRDLAILAGKKRGVDYEGGRRLHIWAREVGFDVVEADAYQGHYLSGEFKRLWSWTLLEAGPSMVEAGLLTEERFEQLASGMQTADEDPNILVGHTRHHQLIARKPS